MCPLSWTLVGVQVPYNSNVLDIPHIAAHYIEIARKFHCFAIVHENLTQQAMEQSALGTKKESQRGWQGAPRT